MGPSYKLETFSRDYWAGASVLGPAPGAVGPVALVSRWHILLRELCSEGKLRAEGRYAVLWLLGDCLGWTLWGRRMLLGWMLSYCLQIGDGTTNVDDPEVVSPDDPAVMLRYLLSIACEMKLEVQGKFKLCVGELGTLYNGMWSKSYLFRLSAKHLNVTLNQKGFCVYNGSRCVCRFSFEKPVPC